MFANVKNKLKSVGKKNASKPDKKADKRFYKDHIEEFRFFVKYYAVFQSIAIAVGKEKIAELNENKPCAFRQESDIPFRCRCEIQVGGTEIKTLKQCKECKASQIKKE